MQLDIVIVNHNAGSYLKNCVEAISKNNGVSGGCEITVCDNGSTDSSLARVDLCDFDRVGQKVFS